MVKNVKFFSQVDLESGIASLAVFLFGEGEVKTSFLGEERVVHLKEEGVREDYYILEIKLWEGMAPYLYSYFVEDKEYRIGLRSLGLDEKRGFFLNGRRYPLDGNNSLVTNELSLLDSCDEEGIVVSFIFPFGHVPTEEEICQLSSHPSVSFWGYRIEGEKEEDMRKLNSILYSLDKTRATMGVFEMDYFCPKVFDVTLKREKSEEEKGVVALFDGKGFEL